jgi:hypothetical protein
MPTPAVDRGLAAGASWVTAGLAARLIDGAVVRSAKWFGVSPLVARGVAAAIGAVAVAVSRRRSQESLAVAAAGTAGQVVMASTVTGAMVTSAGGVAGGLARRVPGGRAVAAGLALASVSAGFGLGIRNRLSRFEADGTPPPALGSVARSLAVAAGMTGAASALISGERAAVRVVGGRAPSSRARAARITATHGVLAIAVGAGAAAAVRAALARVESGNEVIEPGFGEGPVSPAVSSGPGSVVSFAGLGLQGRRFVLEATPVDRIADVMGGPPRAEPIRIYVGYRSASTVAERVQLAIEDIRRTRALERSIVVVASPSGTGYVNLIATEASEYMARGDSAWVSVQYGMRPSLMSADRLTPGGHHHRALLDAIHAECMRTGARPRIMVYGESLGAHTSQNAFMHHGTSFFDELGLHGALYVGTPYRSKWKEQLLRQDRTDVDRSVVGRFDSIADVRNLDEATRSRLRIYLLDHHNDPVTHFGIDLAVQRPGWLGPPAERPPTISSTQRWTPIVTFWQTLIDTKNAATVVPGRFEATGHDYRADLAEFTREAFRFEDVSADQMTAIEERLRRSEMERADRIAGS